MHNGGSVEGRGITKGGPIGRVFVSGEIGVDSASV
jgi:hypothetical protein